MKIEDWVNEGPRDLNKIFKNQYDYFKLKLTNIFNNKNEALDLKFLKGYDKEIEGFKKCGMKSYEIDLLIKKRNYAAGVKYTFKEWFELPVGYSALVYDMEENEKTRSQLYKWYAKIREQVKALN